MHGNAGGADRVSLRLRSSQGVDRQATILLGPTLVNRPRPVTLVGQPHRLIGHHFGDGEAVVDLDGAKVVELLTRTRFVRFAIRDAFPAPVRLAWDKF